MITLALDLVRSRKIMIAGICAGLLLLSIGYLALYPSLEDQLRSMAEDLPDAYKAVLGDADLASPEGYIRSQVYSLIAPLLIAGACISAGASLARAERDQTLAVFAVTPLSRRQLAGAWWLFVGLIASIGALATTVGVVIGSPLAGAEVSVGRIIAATIPLLLFGLVSGGVALLTSTITGAPGAATGMGWLSIVLAFIANSLAELIDSLSWLTNLNPWSWHGAGSAITGDANATGLNLLVIAAVVLGAGAIARFDRRNLHF
ncbi:MAG: ABC-2 type transport system permease protein [Verrucomicrobiales bacterium]|jgi:ABC-2 type transport system permease protein